MSNAETGKQPEMQLSQTSKELLSYAQIHARNWNHRYIGSEHLIMALYDDPKISSVLTELGANKQSFFRGIEICVGVGDYPYRASIEVGLAPRAKRALAHAETISTESGRQDIEPTDIVLGLIAQESDEAVGILESLGVTQEKLIAAFGNKVVKS